MAPITVKLVFLTMNCAADVAAEAFRRGAAGYVAKQSAAEELLIAMRKVLQGESYLSPLIARETVTFLQGKSRPDEKRITKRQSEILQLLAESSGSAERGFRCSAGRNPLFRLRIPDISKNNDFDVDCPC